MKTLYVSDLDGTLLRPEQRLSEYALKTLKGLIERGLIFSYATARSVKTAGVITAGLGLRAPVIVHNGVYILESGTNRIVSCERFTADEAREIFETFTQSGLYPLVYTRIAEAEKVSYLREKCSAPQSAFVDSRIADYNDGDRMRQVKGEAEMLDGSVYYFACIDAEESLARVNRRLQEKYRCFFAKDIYSDEFWLEIMPKSASKAASALKLKNILGCEKLVCFGDAINDIPMFEIADECYAVENAAEELKRIATGVIPANTEDGVVKWLERYGELS